MTKNQNYFTGTHDQTKKKALSTLIKWAQAMIRFWTKKKKKKKKRHLEQLKVLRLEPEQAVKDFLDLKMCKILIKLLDQI